MPKQPLEGVYRLPPLYVGQNLVPSFCEQPRAAVGSNGVWHWAVSRCHPLCHCTPRSTTLPLALSHHTPSIHN